MKLLPLVVTLAALLVLSACGNTFHGVGRDMEKMGQGMQNTF